MPAPATYEYAVDTLVAAHTAVLGEIDAGVAAGKIKLYDNSDVLLCTITLTDPAGTVNAGTGQLTITPAGAGTAVATGTCSYGTITDSADTVILSLPAESGGSAVAGKLVLNSTSIVDTASVTVSSATIG
jgi:hypothetical protein